MTKSLGPDMFHFGTSHGRRVIIIISGGGERTKCLYKKSVVGRSGAVLRARAPRDQCLAVAAEAVAAAAVCAAAAAAAANPLRPMKYNRLKTVAYRNARLIDSYIFI
jgi:hypothetical protein